MNNDPIKKPKPKSTQAEKDARVQLVLQMLKEGKQRAEILVNITKYCKITHSQIDNYIADANAILEKEKAELNDIVKNERVQRALEASKKIPTNEELIAMLCRKIDLANPEVTGYELKIIKDEPHNIQRFPSETFYLTALSKIIEYNNKLNGTDQPQQTQAVLVINTNEVLITNEEDLTDE
jgi:hypothetical protein